MSSFMVSLWESVFTPGPTPTLIIATNATFGCLQVLLLILLYTTASYHFLFLSVLCGGLWAAINWFAAEVQAAKAQEDESKSKKAGTATARAKRPLRGKSPEQGSDTETETDPIPPPAVTTGMSSNSTGTERRKVPANAMPPPAAPAQSVPKPTGSPSLLDPSTANSLGDSDILKRRRSLGESSGYVSTDSEWEKVSEGEDSGKR